MLDLDLNNPELSKYFFVSCLNELQATAREQRQEPRYLRWGDLKRAFCTTAFNEEVVCNTLQQRLRLQWHLVWSLWQVKLARHKYNKTMFALFKPRRVKQIVGIEDLDHDVEKAMTNPSLDAAIDALEKKLRLPLSVTRDWPVADLLEGIQVEEFEQHGCNSISSSEDVSSDEEDPKSVDGEATRVSRENSTASESHELPRTSPTTMERLHLLQREYEDSLKQGSKETVANPASSADTSMPRSPITATSSEDRPSVRSHLLVAVDNDSAGSRLPTRAGFITPRSSSPSIPSPARQHAHVARPTETPSRSPLRTRAQNYLENAVPGREDAMIPDRGVREQTGSALRRENADYSLKQKRGPGTRAELHHVNLSTLKARTRMKLSNRASAGPQHDSNLTSSTRAPSPQPLGTEILDDGSTLHRVPNGSLVSDDASVGLPSLDDIFRGRASKHAEDQQNPPRDISKHVSTPGSSNEAGALDMSSTPATPFLTARKLKNRSQRRRGRGTNVTCLGPVRSVRADSSMGRTPRKRRASSIERQADPQMTPGSPGPSPKKKKEGQGHAQQSQATPTSQSIDASRRPFTTSAANLDAGAIEKRVYGLVRRNINRKFKRICVGIQRGLDMPGPEARLALEDITRQLDLDLEEDDC